MTGHAWLDGRRGHGLAITVAALVLAIAWLGAVQPALGWFHDRREHLKDQEMMLQHLRIAAEQLPALKNALAQRSNRLDPDASEMLPAGSDGASAALLLQQVEAIASASGARLASVETPPAENVAQWRKVFLRIRLEGKASDVMTFLQNTQDRTPRIFADDMEFRCDGKQGRDAACTMLASMRLYAFRPQGKGQGT